MSRTRRAGEGTVCPRERGDGSTAYRAIIKIGRARESKAFDSDREAESWIRAQLVDAERGQHVASDRTTVAAFAQRWLEEQEGRVAPTTLHSWASKVRCHIRPALGHKKLQEVGPADVEALLRRFDNSQMRSGVRRTLHAIFAAADREGLVRGNPAAAPGLSKSLRRVKRRSIERLPIAEVVALVDWLDGEPYGGIWRLMAYTGMARRRQPGCSGPTSTATR